MRKAFDDSDPTRRFATMLLMRGALVAMVVTLVGGVLGAFYSIPALAPSFQALGLDLRQFRPIHTTFAGAWIFMGGATVVYRYLQDHGGLTTPGDRLRLRIQVLTWAAAGAGILLTLMLGIGSGREYVGFHPAFSALILIGWVCYAWNFFRVVGGGFWKAPVYITMWGVAMIFFMYTFLEQHAYLLPGMFSDPVHDLRVQWKATGTLVGSFNLFVYGSIIYIGDRISGDGRYGHSRTAYALLGVGLLNSFTNFAHHTYHLPQRELVKWIAFVVSMMEIIILARVVWELWSLVVTRDERDFCPTRESFSAAKWWTFGILGTSLLISIPPLNAIIHGTYVVTGHAMGATIGIDTMILLGAIMWILGEALRAESDDAAADSLHAPRMKRTVVGLNLAVAALVGWLHVAGVVTGVTRIQLAPGEPYVPPHWLGATSGLMFALTGTVALIFFALLLWVLLPLSFRYFRPSSDSLPAL